jgi:hypothetical protein
LLLSLSLARDIEHVRDTLHTCVGIIPQSHYECMQTLLTAHRPKGKTSCMTPPHFWNGHKIVTHIYYNDNIFMMCPQIKHAFWLPEFQPYESSKGITAHSLSFKNWLIPRSRWRTFLAYAGSLVSFMFLCVSHSVKENS